MTPASASTAELLGSYRVPGTELYLVGTFERGVTVLSQQIRALNLAYGLVEDQKLLCASNSKPPHRPQRVAIVGGGFAGLSVAAGLLKKEVTAHVTIFEQRDTLLPLQQGSDSRWLHPRIYEWPAPGSESSSAMLPVLNWTAGRASDVVVQILSEWRLLVDSRRHKEGIELFCNSRHLQIHRDKPDSLRIEWTGEQRDPADATDLQNGTVRGEGRAEAFDVVVLAVGFGAERDGASSYWRNETLAQPDLDHPRQTYLVSGQGDGAMVDLFRLRISRFRQDRILGELFHGRPALLHRLRELYRDKDSSDLFAPFEAVSGEHREDFKTVVDRLSRRLRRDTEVILRLKVQRIADLLSGDSTRVSFQNRLLAYLLFKCGAFVPTNLDEATLMKQHSIPRNRVIRRHGTLRESTLRALLSPELQKSASACRSKPPQLAEIQWPGGYFGYAGPSFDTDNQPDDKRVDWRKEHLPGPTALLATTFCGALAGYLLGIHAHVGYRLRVTMHRAMRLGDEHVLQQACDYVGTANTSGGRSTAGRAFPARNAMIGQAFLHRLIVHSQPGVAPLRLAEEMQKLNLNAAARKMSDTRFLLAIPVLALAAPNVPGAVVAVIYVDSTDPSFGVDDDILRVIVAMANGMLAGLHRSPSDTSSRIRNVTPPSPAGLALDDCRAPIETSAVLVYVKHVEPPRTLGLSYLNYDYTDFIPVAE